MASAARRLPARLTVRMVPRWWTIGTYALYAAFGIAIAAITVLVAFVFELVEVLRDRKVVVPSKAGAAATA